VRVKTETDETRIACLIFLDTHVTVRAMSESALLTAREVAERLNVSRQTIWRWGQDGTLPRVTIAGTVRFRAEDVEALAQGAA
jgi:excisionase family DNA binding protein